MYIQNSVSGPAMPTSLTLHGFFRSSSALTKLGKEARSAISLRHLQQGLQSATTHCAEIDSYLKQAPQISKCSSMWIPYPALIIDPPCVNLDLATI